MPYLSSRCVDIEDKTSRLVDEAARVGLKINAKKSKVMRINARNDQRIKVNDEQVDDVEEFLYLGALLDKEGGATKDIQQRLSKARQTFYRSKQLSEQFDVWLRSLETHENKSKEAGRFPIQMHETHTENKMATDHLAPTNPGDHRSEQNE